MATYQPLYDPASKDLEPPSLVDEPFRSPADVLEHARRDHLIPWKTWPEVWHLDVHGRFHCYFRAFTGDRITGWAADPRPLFKSRAEGLASTDGCAPNWLIIETRYIGDPTPTEADVQALFIVRDMLAKVGVNLIDDVVFDSTNQWWSLHDLVAPGAPYTLVAERAEDRQSVGEFMMHNRHIW
jgi:hypothetical protein